MFAVSVGFALNPQRMPELHEADAMADELKDFRRKVSVAGRYSYDARVGKHDDLVLAVAIGLWVCSGRPKTPVAQTGTFQLVM